MLDQHNSIINKQVLCHCTGVFFKMHTTFVMFYCIPDCSKNVTHDNGHGHELRQCSTLHCLTTSCVWLYYLWNSFFNDTFLCEGEFCPQLHAAGARYNNRKKTEAIPAKGCNCKWASTGPGFPFKYQLQWSDYMFLNSLHIHR